jgi:hypothetical protein
MPIAGDKHQCIRFVPFGEIKRFRQQPCVDNQDGFSAIVRLLLP